jgi:hypothetical protein
MPSAVPIVPLPRPVPGTMGNIPSANSPSPIILPQIGIAPKLPSWIIIGGFVLFLGAIAEVDSWSKYAGNVSTRYTGAGGGIISQKAVILIALAGAVGVIFFLSYNLSIVDLLTAVTWLLHPSH